MHSQNAGRDGPRRILFVAPFGEHGGSEMFLVRVAEGLSEPFEGRALLLGHGPLEGMLADAGMPVDVEALPGKAGMLRFPRAGRAWARRLEGEGIDVVHANQAKAALFAIPLARRLGVPILWMKHDHFFDGRVSRWLARRCDRVAVVSRAMAAQFTGALADRVSVVYPGVRMPAEAPPHATGPVIAMAGRMDPLKDFGAVIRATALLRDRGHDAQLRLAGTVDRVHPGHAAELDALVTKLGLDDHVAIAATDDMGGHYRRARVFVLPSPPKAGRPAQRGCADGADGGHGPRGGRGRRPPARDRGGAWATWACWSTTCHPRGGPNALEPFLADPEMAQRVGRQGRERAMERFSMAHTVAQLQDLYGRMAADHS